MREFVKMDRGTKLVLDNLTEATLYSLKLQTCWQIARHLDIPYNRRHSAETLRSLIRDSLFPKTPGVPELEDMEGSLISQFDELEVPGLGVAISNEIESELIRPSYPFQPQGPSSFISRV